MSTTIQRPVPTDIRQVLEHKFLADPVSTFDSGKNGRSLPVWSARDRAFCSLAENSPAILSYEDRPELLPLHVGGRTVLYVVDFRVDTRCATILVGLSLSLRTVPHVVEAAIHASAEACCARRGEMFVHVSDVDIVRMTSRISRPAAA